MLYVYFEGYSVVTDVYPTWVGMNSNGHFKFYDIYSHRWQYMDIQCIYKYGLMVMNLNIPVFHMFSLS